MAARPLCVLLALLGAPCQPIGSSAAGDTAYVTCGSSIKLASAMTKHRLHSQPVLYSRGSNLQSVTAFPTTHADGASYWVVHGTKDEPCRPGSPIRRQQRVRLQHAVSRKWLHSSNRYFSPLSGNQEVSAYGGDNQSNGGDVWSISWEGSANHWRQDVKVTLQHADTRSYLHALRQAMFGHPVEGHHEVCAVKRQSRESEWFAAEGVYMPLAESNRTSAAAAAPAPASAPASGGVNKAQSGKNGKGGSGSIKDEL